MSDKIYIYDSTLRDGAQTRGVDFSVVDKQDIAAQLHDFGVDYIEGGWPGANPTDDEFFAEPNVDLVAFGMTRRPSRSAENDPSLNALTNAKVKACCIVGKAAKSQVEKAIEIDPAENLKMISESIAYIQTKDKEAFFDAEHFFDGYKENPEYALSCIKAAYDAGARWVILCDTNGGTLPHEVFEIVSEVAKHIPSDNLGIHAHNDTENAVANSIEAVRAGVRQVQGTLNGLGERCGNANLVSLIPTLTLKMGFKTGIKDLTKLKSVSRYLDEKLNRASAVQAAYVGDGAFAHKGGLHVSAVAKDPSLYEHIKPELVGNSREIMVSDQAGKANFVERLKKLKIDFSNGEKLNEFIAEIKKREAQGYSYEGADASFEIEARKRFEVLQEYFNLTNFRIITARRQNAIGDLITISEATVKITVNGEKRHEVAEGNGPVDALDKATKKLLQEFYPKISENELVDYKVRIINSGAGTKALTRVLIETQNKAGKRWATMGVSENVIDASFKAIHDSMYYGLMEG